MSVSKEIEDYVENAKCGACKEQLLIMRISPPRGANHWRMSCTKCGIGVSGPVGPLTIKILKYLSQRYVKFYFERLV